MEPKRRDVPYELKILNARVRDLCKKFGPYGFQPPLPDEKK
jgi:hypothetical protein